jgi:hypothetical protein
MKIPCFLDAPPESWLRGVDEKDTLDLLFRELRRYLIYTRSEFLPKAKELAASGKPKSTHYETLLAEVLIFANELPDSSIYRIEQSEEHLSPLFGFWRTHGFQLVESKYFMSNDDRLAIQSNFDNSLQFHIQKSFKLQVIDPYFASQICAGSDTRDPFGHIARGTPTKIEIFSALNRLRLKDIESWGSWLDFNGKVRTSLSEPELIALCNNRTARESLFIWRLEQQLNKLNDAEIDRHEIEISLYDDSTFPHDRHISFAFRKFPPTEGASVLLHDYFALGNGLTTLGYLGSSRKPSHVYSSDVNRMWSGFGQSIRSETFRAKVSKKANSSEWLPIK